MIAVCKLEPARTINFPGKINASTYIPENIFYRLAMKAKNEVAQKFQILVADEILPTIRRHGAYIAPVTLENIIADPAFGIRLLTALCNTIIQKKRATSLVLTSRSEEQTLCTLLLIST